MPEKRKRCFASFKKRWTVIVYKKKIKKFEIKIKIDRKTLTCKARLFS